MSTLYWEEALKLRKVRSGLFSSKDKTRYKMKG
jgi:hypothetical protein